MLLRPARACWPTPHELKQYMIAPPTNWRMNAAAASPSLLASPPVASQRVMSEATDSTSVRTASVQHAIRTDRRAEKDDVHAQHTPRSLFSAAARSSGESLARRTMAMTRMTKSKVPPTPPAMPLKIAGTCSGVLIYDPDGKHNSPL